MTILSPTAPTAESEGKTRGAPDIVLIVAMLALMALGVLMVYSASRDAQLLLTGDESRLMTRQIYFVLASVVAFGVLSIIDYREFQHYSPLVYAGTILLLVAVFFQPARSGASRWIILPGGFQLQPSEFAKVAVILLLAAVLARSDAEKLPWRVLAQTLAVLAIPAMLVVVQPDLGTSLVFGFLVLVILFAGDATYRQLSVLAALTISGVWAIFRLDLLQDYQKARLTSFLDPASDPTGTAYNQLNSVTTIGSGQLFGKGYLNGALTQRAFVPEQETDFIFTAVGEQLGFVGGALVLGAFAVIILRLLRIASASRDRFGSLVAVGVAGLFVFHVFVNVGMTVGIMPVTGLPLPFMSHGGSSMLAMASALGVAHSIWLRRSKVPGPKY